MTAFTYDLQRDGSDDSSDVSMSDVTRSPSPKVQIAEEEVASDDGSSRTPTKMEARAYQLEMFDLSLKQNVIVAMDTGSGKTQIALLRMRAELDTCAPHKVTPKSPCQVTL